MKSRYTELIEQLKKEGYSMEDINEIVKLRAGYAKECEKIADQCTEEGFPSHGSNYELRCENICSWYDEREDEIHAKYEKEVKK